MTATLAAAPVFDIETGARQHRHDGAAAAGGRADRLGGQLRRHRRARAVEHPGHRRRPGQPGDEAGQLRLLRHARPGHLAAVRRHRRRLHHGAHHGDGRADQPRRRVAAARGLLGRHAPAWRWPRRRWPRASASARRTRSASACWPRWARRCCTTTTRRATRSSSPTSPTYLGRRAAEMQRYGIHALRLTAVALEQWGFPRGLLVPLRQIDDLTAFEGGLLRVPFELAARLTTEDYEPVRDRPALLRPAVRDRRRPGVWRRCVPTPTSCGTPCSVSSLLHAPTR